MKNQERKLTLCHQKIRKLDISKLNYDDVVRTNMKDEI